MSKIKVKEGWLAESIFDAQVRCVMVYQDWEAIHISSYPEEAIVESIDRLKEHIEFLEEEIERRHTL